MVKQRTIKVEPFINRRGESKFIVVDGNLRPLSGIAGTTKEEATRIAEYLKTMDRYAANYTIKQLEKMKADPARSKEDREIIYHAINRRRMS